MRELKFRYTVKKPNGHIFSEIFTIKQIEQGEISTFIRANLIAEKNIHKEQFINQQDKHNVDIYTGDIMGSWEYKYNQLTGKHDIPSRQIIEGVVEYGRYKTATESSGHGERSQDIYALGFYINKGYTKIPIYETLEILGNIHEAKK